MKRRKYLYILDSQAAQLKIVRLTDEDIRTLRNIKNGGLPAVAKKYGLDLEGNSWMIAPVCQLTLVKDGKEHRICVKENYETALQPEEMELW